MTVKEFDVNLVPFYIRIKEKVSKLTDILSFFTPEIVDPKQGVKSWFDDEHKKEKIAFEYKTYQNNVNLGKITLNMSSANAQDADPEIAKQDTSGISGYETLSDTASLVGGSIKQASRKNFSLVNKLDSDSVCL